jgi:hypothetical protein
MRKSDTAGAMQLLTQKAREATEKQGFEVAAGPKMVYQIGQTDYVGEDKSGAHVGSVITDTDPDGAKFSYNMICVLRRETAGWRISGLAIEINGDSRFTDLETNDLTRHLEESQKQPAAEGPESATANPQNEGVSTPERTGARTSTPPAQR